MSPAPPPRLAVFDCDGTLVDSAAEVCDTMEAAFAAADLRPPDRGAVRRSIGLSLSAVIGSLAPDADEAMQALLIAHYKDLFRKRRQSGALREPLYSGIAELLVSLRAQGWVLAIATGKSDRGLAACLETHGIADLFTSLQTADHHPSKPHPAMLERALFEAGAQAKDAVMIGDTSFDIAMGKAAGIRCVGVAWGYHSPEDLRAQGADAIAHEVRELEALL